MFLGNAEQARTAYLAHKGERVAMSDNMPWEQVILADFAEFEKRGLTHLQMVQIRALFAAAAPGAQPAPDARGLSPAQPGK